MNVFRCPLCEEVVIGHSRVAICEDCHVFMRREKFVSDDSFEEIDDTYMGEEVEEADNG